MRHARTATGPTELLKSIDIKVVPGCNLALIELANFFQHLFFAAGIAAVLCARPGHSLHCRGEILSLAPADIAAL